MAKINRTIFFNLVRTNPFGGRLTQQNVDGTGAILDAWEASHYADQPLDGLAYILATAFGETGTMKWDVREIPPKGRTRAEYFETRYGINSRPDLARTLGNTSLGDGGKYYGRGWPQITGKSNYQKLQNLTGVPFVKNPDLALTKENSAVILLEGMYRGLFTGRKLGDYFDGKPVSAEEGKRRRVAARAIINGRDKAETFARIAAGFGMALVAATASKAALFDVADLVALPPKAFGLPMPDLPGVSTALQDLAPAVVNAAVREATGGKVSLPVDKGSGIIRSTIIQGSVLAGLPGVLAAVTSIQDRAVALAVIAAIVAGVALVVTGRVKIQNEAGV